MGTAMPEATKELSTVAHAEAARPGLVEEPRGEGEGQEWEREGSQVQTEPAIEGTLTRALV